MIALGSPSFYYSPHWSPDSSKLLYHRQAPEPLVRRRGDRQSREDRHRSLRDTHPRFGAFVVARRKVDRVRQAAPEQSARDLPLLARRRTKLPAHGRTERRRRSPVFDRSGKYLYFAASTDVGRRSQLGRSCPASSSVATRSVYAVCPSQRASLLRWRPRATRKRPATRRLTTGRSRTRSRTQKKRTRKRRRTRAPRTKRKPRRSSPYGGIDLDGIGQRIVALPDPLRKHSGSRSTARKACSSSRSRHRPSSEATRGTASTSGASTWSEKRKVKDFLSGG